MPADAETGLRPPVYVDTDAGLAKLVGTLRNQSWIAVDTESNPLFAYRERLCLIQISTRTKDYIIDPLADLELARLVPIMADPAIVKVFHDAEFDVLMLKRTLPIEIRSIFDTKIVATALGIESVGLAPILKDFFDVTLDKKYQRSDWGRRPLTEGQLDYARYDTHFLLSLANDLRARLYDCEEIRQLEVAAECNRVARLVPEVRTFNPDDFTKVKGWDRLDPGRRRVLRELYVARHEIAERMDRPAFKVLPSEMLLRLAQAEPQSMDDLKRKRLMSTKLRERHGEVVLDAIARGKRLAPLTDEKIHRTRKPVEALSEEQRAAYESLRNWRKRAATRRKADASLVLPRATMLELSRLRSRPRELDGLANLGILEPWRLQYYGEEILEALSAVSSAREGRRSSSASSSSSGKRPKRRRRPPPPPDDGVRGS